MSSSYKTEQIKILVLLILIMAGGNSYLQAQNQPESNYFFLAHEVDHKLTDGVFVDLDEDGDLDLVGYDFQNIRLLENVGAGIFKLNLEVKNNGNISMGCGDLNGDQLNDIVIGGLQDENYIFFSTGAWSLGEPSLLSTVGYAQTNDIEIVDLDQDGDLDIGMAGRNLSVLQYFRNNGHGEFARWQSTLEYTNTITDLEYKHFDSDGILEMVTSGDDGIIVWKLDEIGHYQKVSTISDKEYLDIEIEDINMDGALDVMGVRSTIVDIWINTGVDFEFSYLTGLNGSSLRELEVFDINEDSYPDLYVSSYSVDNIYINNSGTFPDDPVPNSDINAANVIPGDLDADGDIDIYIISIDTNTNDEFWFNKTRGIYLESNELNFETPPESVATLIFANDNQSTEPDFNFQLVEGTGDTHNLLFRIEGNELILASDISDPCVNAASQLFIRINANNNFDSQFESFFVISVVDFPEVPIVEPFIYLSPQEVDLYAPLGAQIANLTAVHSNTCNDFTFDLVPGLGDNHNASFSIIDDKLILANEIYSYGSEDLSIRIGANNGFAPYSEVNLNLLLTNQPQITGAYFTQSSQNFSSDDSRDVGLGDLNGDGYVDAYVANLNGANKMWFGDGSGEFSESNQFFPNTNSTAVEVADLDLDNDLDVFITNAGAQSNEIWLNDGSGNLTLHQSLGNSNSRSVALGDLNDDGSIDAFVGNYNGQSNRVWLNDGNGNFNIHPTLFGNASTVDVEIGDINNDGRLDLVTGDYSEGVHSYLNLGVEQFGDAIQINLVPRITSIELGDFDEDGYLDIICGTAMGNNRIWSQDGALNFSQSGFVGQGKTKDMKIGDMNGDGYLDVLVVNTNGSNQIVLNQGGATFVSTNQNFGNRKGNAGAIYDINNDGTLDLFVANRNQPNQVWFNELGNSNARFLDAKSDLSTQSLIGMKFLKGDLTLIESSNSIIEKVYTYDLSGRAVPIKKRKVDADTNSHVYSIFKTNSIIIVKVVTSNGIKSFKLNNSY